MLYNFGSFKRFKLFPDHVKENKNNGQVNFKKSNTFLGSDVSKLAKNAKDLFKKL